MNISEINDVCAVVGMDEVESYTGFPVIYYMASGMDRLPFFHRASRSVGLPIYTQ